MNFQLNSLYDRERARFSAQCSSFVGAEAIDVEKPGIFCVRVSQISYDTWGVRITTVDTLMPGMHRLSQSPSEISASWEVFSFSANHWQARYVPWQLFFDPTLVRSCTELAAQANQRDSTIDWNDAMKMILDWQRAQLVAAEKP
jgi:hypothetical protein